MKTVSGVVIVLLCVIELSHGGLMLWPKPKDMDSDERGCNQVVQSATFFVVMGHDSDILQSAIKRYNGICFGGSYLNDTLSPLCAKPTTQLTGVHINVLSTSTTLQLGTNESYTLTLNGGDKGLLVAETVFGALRGLETLSLMIIQHSAQYYIPVRTAAIRDFPRFSHRGLLIDTGRHYLDTTSLSAILDAMAYNKLNVLHWHMVDDQAFPFNSTTFPLLAEKGAFSWRHTYSHADIASVLKQATDRGIRVIPEFDMPGHCKSWGKGYPKMETSCPGVHQHFSHPMNPITNYTYNFVQKLWEEVSHLFIDPFVHLGGDEVDTTCWQNNPSIQQWMKAHNRTDYHTLQAYFERRLVETIITQPSVDRSSIVWEEVFTNRGSWKIPKDVVIEVWKSQATDKKKLKEVVSAGLRAVYTTPDWYLDYHQGPGHQLVGDWKYLYTIDPYYDINLTPQEKELIVGGEVCMWAPYEDASNFMSVVFPRASAVGEVLWSNHEAASRNPTQETEDRLHQFRCRMLRRGITSAPVVYGGYCPIPWPFHYKKPF
eukprot:TRINITY_DN67886_c1_g2_i1.p1 TRINITY_DN67886_c1_g2~~TRINITY_DN67886_c1_g2_i1.p1  ORF type:complete len:543 (+),score=25.01 TRINITY_DN67886_c1_g2_i1:48-1676(+)